MSLEDGSRPLALATGASRSKGIGAAVALDLARGGWDVAMTFWPAYDATIPWGSDPADAGWLLEQLGAYAVKTAAVEAGLSLVETPPFFDAVEQAIRPVTVLVLSHCQCTVDRELQTGLLSGASQLFDTVKAGPPPSSMVFSAE